MRMFKRAAVAVVTAGSLSVLGAGVAQADAKKPELELNSIKQAQSCTYAALVPINVNALAFGSSVGSVNCTQVGAIK